MNPSPPGLKALFSDPRWIALAGVFALLVGLIALMGELLVPIVLAIVLAYFLNGDIVRLQQRMPRGVAVTLVFSCFLLVYLLIILGPLQLAIRQSLRLVSNAPQIAQRTQVLVASLELPDFASEYLRLRTDQILRLAGSQFEGTLHQVLSQLTITVTGITTLGVYLLLVPLLVIFFIQDRTTLEAWVVQLLPRNREFLVRIWNEMESRMGQYIRGKLWEILAVGVASGIAFYLLGFQYAAIMALGAGISVLIPYVGAIAITIPIFLLGVLQWGFTTELFWLLFAHVLLQFLDGNVLVPLLFSEAMKLPPTIILLATLFFGNVWGLWGVFFAIPLATLFKALLEVYLEYRDASV